MDIDDFDEFCERQMQSKEFLGGFGVGQRPLRSPPKSTAESFLAAVGSLLLRRGSLRDRV